MSDDREDDRDDGLDALRDRLVLAALAHAPFEGWSQAALAAAARDAGLDPTMPERLFTQGPAQAVEHLAALADRRMEEAARAHDLAAMRFPERIAWLVRRRLEPWSAHREALRRATSLLALPTQGVRAARIAWRTVDAIWYAAGDVSTDFSYYTRRAILAAIYGATVLVWLDDESPECEETWAFLERRLADQGRMHRAQTRAKSRLVHLPGTLRSLAGGRKRPGRPHRRSGARTAPRSRP